MTDPLAPCVHCGFCLPACPTYLATGDEADSPRGRIVLMRALERGELEPDDPALVQHLDACLGCRGCEPVCPSGVSYGRGLESARERLFETNGGTALARLVLGTFRHERWWRPLFTLGRALRHSGIPRAFTGSGRLGFQMGMLAATRGLAPDRTTSRPLPDGRDSRPDNGLSVSLFRGCVMDTLFEHVNAATRRTLEANGYRVREIEGQACCGALHEHAGDRGSARALAVKNLEAFGGSGDAIAVNSAGCGALLKDYGHLVGEDAAAAFGERVRDVSELLAAVGPRQGASIDAEVAYDAPCHLQHAQRVQDAPLAVLSAIPGLRLRLLPGSDKCCGSAGIYSVLHPAMARAVLDAKISAIAAATPRPDLIATGNPGCLMQIGAGLAAAGLDVRAVHPVELLDESYRRAGLYGGERRREKGEEG
ncbi:MAG TPA: heterodisulfide reductase-related iron-sulfur binding cluster [Gemmatimonadales bacterium]